MNTNQNLQSVVLQSKPKFQHDCDTCRYLGQSEGEDLYACPASFNVLGPTLIVRRSDEGPDYRSVPMAIFEKNLVRRTEGPEEFQVDSRMVLAYALAKATGL